MTESGIGLGIIGCGDVALRTYGPGLAPLAGRATAVAVYDPDPARAERLAEDLGALGLPRPTIAPTLDALLRAIGERAANAKPGEWILARGYDQTKLDVKRHPHRDELDRAAPNNPVMLVRTCGHVSICMSHSNPRVSTLGDAPNHRGTPNAKVAGMD